MTSKKRITLAILAATALVGAGLVASAVNAARPPLVPDRDTRKS